MANKEAIEHLRELKTLRIEFPNTLQEQALDLAIKALEERSEGKWEEPFEHNGKMYHKCNHCHISSPLMLIDNYCSYCGAVMQKGGKNNDK